MTSGAPETWARALRAGLERAGRGGDARAASRAAAEALAGDPWAVVSVAGALARAAWGPAPRDLGIGVGLSCLPVDHPAALVRVLAGAPYPGLDPHGRRARGAFDTAPDLARRAVALALAAADRPVRRALDPACGTGAFLVALAEAGVPEVAGWEIDPVAAAVAEIAAPGARVRVVDGLRARPDGPLDAVVGNPPFVPPERQDRALRAALREEMPWLEGRFDLAVPFAARAAEALAPGGGLCLLLPAPLLCQPYARPLRRALTEAHQLTALESPLRFPGAVVYVALVALRAGAGPAALPDHGLSAASWATLEAAPWDAELRPGDPEILAGVRAASLRLGELCEIDTGVVAHGPGGPKSRLLADAPGPGLLPYADARDLATGRCRWIRYTPEAMHRPKRLSLFAGEKLLVQRLRGGGAVRVWLDREGVIAGHTLNVVRPRDGRVPLTRLRDLLTAPESAGLARLAWGPRLDLYPHDLVAWPVPRRWLQDPDAPLREAWGLSDAEFLRLQALARAPGHAARPRVIAEGARGR